MLSDGRTICLVGRVATFNQLRCLRSIVRPGVLAMFDRNVRDGDPCTPWHCPVDREPVPEWWTRTDPCPDGGQLQPEVGGAHCELAGEPHGPTTRWIPVEQGWDKESGWYEHGKRCGKWHVLVIR